MIANRFGRHDYHYSHNRCVWIITTVCTPLMNPTSSWTPPLPLLGGETRVFWLEKKRGAVSTVADGGLLGVFGWWLLFISQIGKINQRRRNDFSAWKLFGDVPGVKKKKVKRRVQIMWTESKSWRAKKSFLACRMHGIRGVALNTNWSVGAEG